MAQLYCRHDSWLPPMQSRSLLEILTVDHFFGVLALAVFEYGETSAEMDT